VKPIRLVVVDDHPTFVRAVSVLLETDSGIDVVATASDGADAVDIVISAQPDVVLMDVSMPGLDGIAATAAIAEAAPHVAVVALTMFDDDERIGAAVRAGARGYVLKGASPDEIRTAIKGAAAGQAVFGTAVAHRLRGLVAPGPPAPPRPFPQLTDRERDVLDCVAAGLDNTATAQALFLSEKTVRNYVSMILAKLAVATRAEAIVAARESGLGIRDPK
jgi:DNA-binding NarL/FixJ family response regulator